jgi:hypothetical protein
VSTPGSASAADCAVGATTTINGALGHFPMENEGAWVIVEPEKMTPCSVGALRGRGKAPAGCEPGKRFTASGYVTQALFLEMHVNSIRCF